MFPVKIHELKKKPKILEWVYTIPVKIFQRYVRHLKDGFCVDNKFIHRGHHNHLMPFLDELPYNVLPEIVNVPGSIGYDDDSFWVHFFIAAYRGYKLMKIIGLWGYEGYGAYKGYKLMTVSTDYFIRHSV